MEPKNSRDVILGNIEEVVNFGVHNKFAYLKGVIDIAIARHTSELSSATDVVKRSMVIIQKGAHYVIEREEQLHKRKFFDRTVTYIPRFTTILNSITIIDALDNLPDRFVSFCIEQFRAIESLMTIILKDIETFSTGNAKVIFGQTFSHICLNIFF